MQLPLDLRHALRVLLATPGVTLTALVALALAIGANSAMFSIVDAVLIRPLPLADPDRIVMVWEDASHIGFPRNTPAPANWRDWREQNSVFSDIAATRSAAYSLTGDGPPEHIPARRVTASFWSVMQAPTLLGRTFTEEEDRQAAKLAVLSHSLWQRRYGSDPSVIGRKILLSNEPYVVTGVMPPAFSFPSRRVEIWTPASFTPEEVSRRGSHFLQCVARLKPGVTVADADREMKSIAKRLEQQYPENRNVGAVVVPLAEQLTGNTSTRLMVLFSASGLVLLIACANIANLLLSKAADREREIAVRTALGAGRARIIGQLLTESLLLAGGGALLGIGVARICMVALEKLVPMQMAAVALRLDWRMLAFTTCITVLTGVLFGVFPALALGRVQIQDSLRQGGRISSSGSRRRLRDMLVVSQTALALALLSCAGLMIQTLRNLESVDIGIRADNLLTLSTGLAQTRYPTHAARHAFYNRVLEGVRTIPGVMAAGYTSDLPLTAQGNTSGYVLQGDSSAIAQDALFRVVTPGFLEALGARMREGRTFDRDDRADTQAVALVNETLADRHWRGQSAIGKRISIDGGNRPWLTVVGVVKEIRERGINIETKPALYMPVAQSEGYWPNPSDLAVRTSNDPSSVVGPVRQAIAAADRDQPVSDVLTMTQVVDEELSREQQQMSLFSAFAALALVLASTGIYGVVAYTVSQRRREIGIRMALGATPAGVLRDVFGRGLQLVGIGVAAGLLLTVAASRLLAALLYGVRPQDPATLTASTLLLASAALAACLLPAASAARTDPASILRDQ